MPSLKNQLRKIFTKNVVDVAQALVSLKFPGQVITDDISTSWVEVGEDNIIRLEVGLDTYVAFSADGSAPAVDSTTSPAVKLSTGTHYVKCSQNFVRASTNPARIELLTL